MSVISESGLYNLTLTSRKPASKRFKKWVTGEVLPSIRRTGRYHAPRPRQAPPPTALPRGVAADARTLRATLKVLDIVDRNELAIAVNCGLRKLHKVDVLALAELTALPAQTTELFMTPTELGKEIGASGQKVNQMLATAGFQQKTSAGWRPTKDGKHLAKMFDVSRSNGTGSAQQLKWSNKIISLLAGMLPATGAA